jgi:hypothetical protein
VTQQDLNEQNFFDNTGGSGAPSAKLTEVNDGVVGEIVDQRMVDATDFATKEVLTDKKTGKVIQQLQVILQTESRNWDGVSKVPLVDKDDRNSAQKDPSEDDGRRAVYIKPWTNIHAAVGDAVKKSNGGKPGPLRNGARFGIKITELRDVGKGNPLKVHQAFYEAPAASGDFFSPEQTQSAPVTAPAPAATGTPPPAATQTPSGDPWATPAAAPAASTPPF